MVSSAQLDDNSPDVFLATLLHSLPPPSPSPSPTHLAPPCRPAFSFLIVAGDPQQLPPVLQSPSQLTGQPQQPQQPRGGPQPLQPSQGGGQPWCARLPQSSASDERHGLLRPLFVRLCSLGYTKWVGLRRGGSRGCTRAWHEACAVQGQATGLHTLACLLPRGSSSEAVERRLGRALSTRLRVALALQPVTSGLHVYQLVTRQMA